MNAHLFLFGPTGSGKSATLNNILNQVTAIYRPRLFIVEAGNSFGLFSDFARRLGLTVNRVKLAPDRASASRRSPTRRLIETPSDVQTLDADALDEDLPPDASGHGCGRAARRAGRTGDHARLMITGGEDKEEAG
jgi:septin family protein